MPRNTKASTEPASPSAQRIRTLSELCAEAAQHVAEARMALFNESADAERALAHLDEAIDCLKRLLAHGRAARLNSGATLRPA
jgi:hypothetical protein